MKFFQEEGLILFDEKPNVDFELDNDLNNNKLNFFLDKAKISQVLEKKDILDNLYPLKDGYLKNAGVLLFCQIIIKGGPREERLELPEDALREGLLNAIAHRDYFISGANILVDW
jgi:ATP-dependent DNA helicase RecG